MYRPTHSPQAHHTHVQTIPQKVDEVPHVAQITLHAHCKYLLHLLPHEPNHIEHHHELQLSGGLATLTQLLLSQLLLHPGRSEDTHKVIVRPLRHQNQDDCKANNNEYPFPSWNVVIKGPVRKNVVYTLHYSKSPIRTGDSGKVLNSVNC